LRIPEKANEIFITGGKRIVLGQKSFDRMPALTLLHIEGTRTLVMEKQSFRNLTSPSLLIQIQNCDHLSIKTGAFENVQVRVSQTVQTDEQNGVPADKKIAIKHVKPERIVSLCPRLIIVMNAGVAVLLRSFRETQLSICCFRVFV
jgi:hypothetical protein